MTATTPGTPENPTHVSDDEQRHLLVELAALAEDHRTMPDEVAARIHDVLRVARESGNGTHTTTE